MIPVKKKFFASLTVMIRRIKVILNVERINQNALFEISILKA
jgi:hypothetical protein